MVCIHSSLGYEFKCVTFCCSSKISLKKIYLWKWNKFNLFVPTLSSWIWNPTGFSSAITQSYMLLGSTEMFLSIKAHLFCFSIFSEKQQMGDRWPATRLLHTPRSSTSVASSPSVAAPESRKMTSTYVFFGALFSSFHALVSRAPKAVCWVPGSRSIDQQAEVCARLSCHLHKADLCTVCWNGCEQAR